MTMLTDFDLEVERQLPQLSTPRPERCGTLVRLVGMRLEARGIMAPIGSCCEISTRSGHVIEAEVVGFNDKTLYLMPLQEPVGLEPGALVKPKKDMGSVCLGPELLGRVLDGRGNVSK